MSIILILLVGIYTGLWAQELEPTAEAVTAPPLVLTETPTASAAPTETPTTAFTPTETPTASFTPTETETVTAAPSETWTPEATEALVLTETPPSEATDAVLPSETPTIEDSSATPTLTEESVTETVTAAPSETPTLPESTAEVLTPTSSPEMIVVGGAARYQSRPDQWGIHVIIMDASGAVLTSASTDGAGLYALLVPVGQPVQLAAEAPLYRRVELIIQPGEAIPDIVLAGGDLNQDGCIGATDLALLTAQFDVVGSPATDINGDGLTEASDLAILAGNFESGCEMPLVTPTPEMPTTLTPEATPEVTLTLEPTVEATQTLELTPEPTVVPTDTPPDMTMTPEAMPTETELPPEPDSTAAPA